MKEEELLEKVGDLIEEYACNPEDMSLERTAIDIIKLVKETKDEN